MKVSYNIINDKNQIQLFLEENTGEHSKEISDELFSDLSDESNPRPFKIVDGEIIVDETQLRINNISQELESTNGVINEIMEYMINDQEVPQELLDIRDSRNVLKEELSELEQL